MQRLAAAARHVQGLRAHARECVCHLSGRARSLAKYPEYGKSADLEFAQNKAPRVTAPDLTLATLEMELGHDGALWAMMTSTLQC